jgi:hypothetical protein
LQKGFSMKNLLLSTTFFGAFLFASMAQAGTSYRLDMKVFYNGEQIAMPTIVVANDKQADLIIDNPKASSPKVRMLVSAESGMPTSAGKETIGVKVIFLESVADAWVVVAEPVVGVFPGTESSLQMGNAVKSGTAPYEVRMTASLFDPATMSIGSEKVSTLGGSNCPAKEGTLLFTLASVFGISTANAGPGGPGCCSVQNLTCCGASICCNNVNNRLVCCSPNP